MCGESSLEWEAVTAAVTAVPVCGLLPRLSHQDPGCLASRVSTLRAGMSANRRSAHQPPHAFPPFRTFLGGLCPGWLPSHSPGGSLESQQPPTLPSAGGAMLPAEKPGVHDRLPSPGSFLTKASVSLPRRAVNF